MESNAAEIEEIYSVDWGHRENKAPPVRNWDWNMGEGGE